MTQKIVVLIVFSNFFISCYCDRYYSNSDEIKIEGKLVDIECEIVSNVISTNPDHLKIYIDSKDDIGNRNIDWESIEVYPIINKDTLKIDPNYSTGSYFKYYSDKYKNSKLNLSIKYKFKGDLVLKEEVYKGLNKIRSCHWRFTLH